VVVVCRAYPVYAVCAPLEEPVVELPLPEVAHQVLEPLPLAEALIGAVVADIVLHATLLGRRVVDALAVQLVQPVEADLTLRFGGPMLCITPPPARISTRPIMPKRLLEGGGTHSF
jgi:hypothetical protein